MAAQRRGRRTARGDRALGRPPGVGAVLAQDEALGDGLRLGGAVTVLGMRRDGHDRELAGLLRRHLPWHDRAEPEQSSSKAVCFAWWLAVVSWGLGNSRGDSRTGGPVEWHLDTCPGGCQVTRGGAAVPKLGCKWNEQACFLYSLITLKSFF